MIVFIACCLSGYFILANVYPVLATAEAKATRVLAILIALLHIALALTFKVLFFSYYVIKDLGPGDPLGEDQPGEGPAQLLRL